MHRKNFRNAVLELFEIRNSLTLCRSIDPKRVLRGRDRWCFCGEGWWFLASYLATLSLSFSLCLCIMSRLSGVRVIYRRELRWKYSWKVFIEGKWWIRFPFEGYGSREIDFYIYIHFFLYFFCFYWKSWGEQREYRDTILSVITAILNMTLYREEYYISCVEYTALNKKRSFIEGK